MYIWTWYIHRHTVNWVVNCDKASSITVVAENGCDGGIHFSIPKPFSSGDVVEWFQCFDLCSDANKWEGS